MAKKYYAVRKGSVTGVFEDWETCKKAVDGYPCAEYKSFKTLQEAQDYLSSADPSACSDGSGDKEPCPLPGQVIAYVDGSFNAQTGIYGYGCVLLDSEGLQEELSGTGNHPQAVSSRNVSGELLATMTAVRWASDHGYASILICHDYAGISAWFTGAWKAESYVAKAYVQYLRMYQNTLQISFKKVQAHTGVQWNERADILAKGAVGIL